MEIPSKGVLFGSFLYRGDLIGLDQLAEIWESQWGESKWIEHWYYPMAMFYSKEMGSKEKLQRIFVFGGTLIPREELVDAKIWSDEVEKKYQRDNSRVLNLDPGIVTMENVQLATFKNFIHRIYLGRGVFSDLNLTFRDKSFQKLSWTYPDYGHPEVIEIFNGVRGSLHRALIAQRDKVNFK